VTPDVGIYARAASGFRIGGVNESATIATQEGIAVPATYAPDSLWDYEMGAKGYFLDRRLFLDLTLYHIDWSNEQEDALAAGVYNYTLNVGKSTTNGVEFDANYRPIPDLILSGSITYVDATLAQDLPASVADAGTPGLKGDRMPFVPKVSFAGQVEYDHQITDQFTGYLATDFSYHGDSFTQFRASIGTEPPDYITELPSYFLWDLRAGVRWSNYDLSVFAENVTNSAAWTGASAGLEGVLVYSPRPRTFGLRLAAKF
jgi:outer membrane receptor protein involved in Fe transport